METIGIDLHQKRSRYVMVSQDGRVTAPFPFLRVGELPVMIITAVPLEPRHGSLA